MTTPSGTTKAEVVDLVPPCVTRATTGAKETQIEIVTSPALTTTCLNARLSLSPNPAATKTLCRESILVTTSPLTVEIAQITMVVTQESIFLSSLTETHAVALTSAKMTLAVVPCSQTLKLKRKRDLSKRD